MWLGLAPAALAALLLAIHLHKPALPPPAAAADDLALMRDLELVRELPLLSKLEEAEAFDALTLATPADLEAVSAERTP